MHFLNGKANAAFCPNLADHDGRMHFTGAPFSEAGWVSGLDVCGEKEVGTNEHPKLPKAQLPHGKCCLGGKGLGSTGKPF